MTLFQVTAVEANLTGPSCCIGLVQRVAIGPRRHVTTVRELDGSPSFDREAFYAIIDGQFTDVQTGHCATCGAAYFTTNLLSEANNALLQGFATIGQPEPPEGQAPPQVSGRRWWQRKRPAGS